MAKFDTRVIGNASEGDINNRGVEMGTTARNGVSGRAGSSVETCLLFAQALMGTHLLPKTPRPHVRPLFLDEGEAVGARALTEGDPPAEGDVDERRPQAVLVLVVDKHEEGAGVVIEWVGAHHFSWSAARWR
jgi:hypothetical protein